MVSHHLVVMFAICVPVLLLAMHRYRLLVLPSAEVVGGDAYKEVVLLMLSVLAPGNYWGHSLRLTEKLGWTSGLISGQLCWAVVGPCSG